MNSYFAPTGIRLNDCLFTEPVDLANWRPPQYAGLFAVFVRDPNWAPKPLRPLCFGEFGNSASRATLLGNYNDLVATANGGNLLIAVCPMPFSTTAQRWALRDELVWAYNPACQAEGQRISPGEIASRLQQGIPPQTEMPRQPRRRIGFMPDIESAARQ
jgi:hypothetical protein